MYTSFSLPYLSLHFEHLQYESQLYQPQSVKLKVTSISISNYYMLAQTQNYISLFNTYPTPLPLATYSDSLSAPYLCLTVCLSVCHKVMIV